MIEKKKLKVLIVGAGMYVTGRGANNFGTILPSVCNAFCEGYISEILLSSTSVTSAKYAKKCVKNLSKIFTKKINFKSFPDIKNNVNEYLSVAKKHKPHVAIISVPDHLHYNVSKNLIKLGIHCLVVKPLCDNVKDAKSLIKLSYKYKVLGLVEFHKRFDEANLIIREKLKNKNLGDLLYSVIEYSQKKIIPEKIFKKWHNKTNVFQYLGVHYVDLLYYFTRFSPKFVRAYSQSEYLKNKKINNFDSIQVIIEWEKPNKNKFISYHFSSWIDPNNSSSMSDQKIAITGSLGKIISDQKNRGLQIVDDKIGIQDFNPYFSSLISDRDYSGSNFFGYGLKSITKFLENTRDIVIDGCDFKNFIINNRSFEESLISTAVIEAANKSLKTNKREKVVY